MAQAATPRPYTYYARTLMRRIDELARYSEEPGRLTRRVATPAMQKAQQAVAHWMWQAGMLVRQDSIGNVIGHYEAAEGESVGEGTITTHTWATRTLVLGSHIDTVRDAGRFDGPLGVLAAIACVQRLYDVGQRMPFGVEVVAFADEEGLRFGTAYLGSRVYAGRLDPRLLELADEQGVTLAQAIRECGGDPHALHADRRRPDDLLGYCEVHIEQGPVLEAEHLPVGVVSSIAGQTRIGVQFTGEAGHAGTVPMSMRHDALCAAAEFILSVEALATSVSGLVATVGQVAVHPGASNVIPGQAVLSLDVRHPHDPEREQAVRDLYEQAVQICASRGLALGWQVLQDNPSVPCSPQLSSVLARAVESLDLPVRYLTSGAGHDAVIMSAMAPVAMLFVRCKRGISHHPDEWVDERDVAVALEVMHRFLDMLASDPDLSGGRPTGTHIHTNTNT